MRAGAPWTNRPCGCRPKNVGMIRWVQRYGRQVEATLAPTLGPLPAKLAFGLADVPRQGLAKARDQAVLVERLGQKANRALFQRAGADAFIGNGGNEDERDGIPPRSAAGDCSSIPLIPGMRTSAITHQVFCSCGNSRKASAEVKDMDDVSQRSPGGCISRCGIDSSSSITEITGTVVKSVRSWNGGRAPALPTPSHDHPALRRVRPGNHT